MSDATRRPKARRVLTMKNIVIPPPSTFDGSNLAGSDQTLPISLHSNAENNPSGLNNISLRIDSATFYAVLTDHTTPLLRFIARLTSAASGQIQWRHTLKQRLNGDVIPVAYVPSVSLTPTLNVEDELLSTLAFAGAHIDADQYQSLLEALQLTSLLPQQTHALTQAQSLRVAIARSLLLGARILLLEEPTNGLSDQDAQELLAALKTLRDQGYTVVLQTRSPDVATAADRVFLLIGGEVLGTLDAPEPSILRSEYTTAVQTLLAFERAHTPQALTLPLATPDSEDSEDTERIIPLEADPELDEDTRPVWQPTRATQHPAFTPLPSAAPSAPFHTGEETDAPVGVEDSSANMAPQTSQTPPSAPDAAREEATLPHRAPLHSPRETTSTEFPSAYVHPTTAAKSENTLSAPDPSVEMEEMFPSTTTLPLIPRPKPQTIDADSEEVIARAQNILKDLPGSVLPPTSPQE